MADNQGGHRLSRGWGEGTTRTFGTGGAMKPLAVTERNRIV